MSAFLQAEWRNLAMLNFAIDPGVLASYVPLGTELDLYAGEAYVSLVAFLFLDTRVLEMPIPFHGSFEEVNLRFYVRRHDETGVKRGVVFIQELVARRAIAWTARALYNEPYRVARMAHDIREANGVIKADWEWRIDGRRHALAIEAAGDSIVPAEGSFDQFVAERFWGYTKQRDGGAIEYAVDHPRWRVQPVRQFQIDIDSSPLYGAAFGEALSKKPRSAIFADGSEVTVSRGRRLRNAKFDLSGPQSNTLPQDSRPAR
jgi:hypothetical protein